MNTVEAKRYTNEKLRELRLIRRKDTLQILRIPLIVTGGTIVSVAVSSLFFGYEIKLVTYMAAIIATCLTVNSYISTFDKNIPINAKIKELKEYKRELSKNKNPLKKVLIYKKRPYKKV